MWTFLWFGWDVTIEMNRNANFTKNAQTLCALVCCSFLFLVNFSCCYFLLDEFVWMTERLEQCSHRTERTQCSNGEEKQKFRFDLDESSKSTERYMHESEKSCVLCVSKTITYTFEIHSPHWHRRIHEAESDRRSLNSVERDKCVRARTPFEFESSLRRLLLRLRRRVGLSQCANRVCVLSVWLLAFSMCRRLFHTCSVFTLLLVLPPPPSLLADARYWNGSLVCAIREHKIRLMLE